MRILLSNAVFAIWLARLTDDLTELNEHQNAVKKPEPETSSSCSDDATKTSGLNMQGQQQPLDNAQRRNHQKS